MTWQPIETAYGHEITRKSPVLLWKPSTKEHYVAALVRGANGPGWCTPDGHQIFGASHWQPLPQPPGEKT